jgi:8-oxo-dGTP pyrophosphatase MutT (NUDIX family)
MERLYGVPDHLSHTQKTNPEELARIHHSMKRGRSHDITLFIAKDDSYIFIAKPFYPPGLFRAPSGGVQPDEDFITGAKREALEETGTEIELVKYILRIDIRFDCPPDAIDWTSHIFKARWIRGEIAPRDTHEISAARLAHLDEIPKFREIMLKSGVSGLTYRAFLTDEALKRL